MTLHIFFFIITIQKRKYSPRELINMEHVQKITEENKNRMFSLYRPF
ncbi:YrzI family small protein [Neobacillus notoginsengisoli]|uniref:YrzI family small protein n=1 Tax=Neobacillus notoginsengisoli TaxID=1578198 RepID=A0A417YUN1_9BACI|nr:YrzI family small protein [Neobacillus notoginsengisoli]RHW40969.1 YrzI family small protein [Neobacillus notoginsengisoli]